jgi:hypothetical protein
MAISSEMTNGWEDFVYIDFSCVRFHFDLSIQLGGLWLFLSLASFSIHATLFL